MCLKEKTVVENDNPGKTPNIVKGKVDQIYIYANELTTVAGYHVFVVLHVKHQIRGYILLEVVRTKTGLRVNYKTSHTLNGAISKRLNRNKPAILWVEDHAKRNHNREYFEYSKEIQSVIDKYHGDSYTPNVKISQHFANEVARAIKSDRRCQEKIDSAEIKYGFVHDK